MRRWLVGRGIAPRLKSTNAVPFLGRERRWRSAPRWSIRGRLFNENFVFDDFGGACNLLLGAALWALAQLTALGLGATPSGSLHSRRGGVTALLPTCLVGIWLLLASGRGT